MKYVGIVLVLLVGSIVSAAWHFDEDASHYVSVADNAALTLPDGDFSIGGWLKLDDNDGSGFQYCVSWNHGSMPCMYLLFTEDAAAVPDQFTWKVVDAAADEVSLATTGSPAESTEWQHVMLIRSGAGVFTLYVNGVQDGTVTDDTVDGCDAPTALEFGRRNDGDADRAYGGSMAEWAKWDRALTAEERGALVAGFGPACFPTGLTWYLPMVRPAKELLVPLALTDNGLSVVPHCRIYP